MKRSWFFAIVIGGGIVAVLVALFFIFDNPYRRLNPVPAPSAESGSTGNELPPVATDAKDSEILTVWEGETIGMTTGVDGLRLVFYDVAENKIAVTEFDGTSYQQLSDTLLGVEAMSVSPNKEKAWLQVTDPEAKEVVTLVYDFRAQEAVRLENGISAIDWAPDSSQLVYFVQRAGAAPALKVVSANGVEPRTIREGFAVQDPILEWYGDSQLAYWLEPSSSRPSSVITMNTSGDNAIELSGTGLAKQALFSPDGTFVLVGQNNPATGKPELLLGTTADRDLQSIPLTTWLDKCTWMADSARLLCFVPRDLPGGFTYPEGDDGDNAYRDQLWVIDAATAKPQLIYDVPTAVTDATQPFAANNGSRLNFVSRATGTVISLDVQDKLVAPTTPNAPDVDEVQESAENNTTNTTAPAGSAAPTGSGNSTNNATY